jgi:hypothetical protein
MRDRPETWPVTLILEDGHANAADAVRIFQQEREGLFPQYRPMLDTIRFASKKTAPPVAAVDMLAYSMFRMVAGYTTHAREHVISAGPADPPYIVAKVPMGDCSPCVPLSSRYPIIGMQHPNQTGCNFITEVKCAAG